MHSTAHKDFRGVNQFYDVFNFGKFFDGVISGGCCGLDYQNYSYIHHDIWSVRSGEKEISHLEVSYEKRRDDSQK